jgi:serine/threonine-protein kinase
MSATDEQPTALPAPRVVAGRYHLGARRGSSVDAALFEAYDPELQRPVVVKIVHPELSARPEVQASFRAAMDAAGSLHHPNIAVAHSWGSTEWNGHKVLYVVSEQLTGGSLRDMLDRGRMLTPSQALLVGLDACKALDVLHKRGLAHGDIRPSTLVFGEDRRLRVVDPGLSQVLSEAAGGPMHRPNDLAKYTSPEQAAGGPLEAKSDVYSLCLTMLETVTGSVPFVGDSTVATLTNRIDKLMPVSADLGALASVLERGGRPLPADRYTAAEFGRALVQAAERLPRPAPLPILANSLFGADTGNAHEPVDPTGPLAAMPLARLDAVRATAGRNEMPPPPPGAIPLADPTPTSILPPVPPVADMAPLAPAADGIGDIAVNGTVTGSGIDDDLDPADEFPDRPPTPSGNRRWFLAVLAVMAIAGGALAWYTTRPEMRTVPDLAGMAEGVALNDIAGDFKGIPSPEASETVGTGNVIRTDPVAGTTVEKGSALTLYVSSGPAPRVLEELAGLTVEAATAKLQEQGLTVEVADPVNDETVPAGTVVSWTVPDSPTLVAGGTVVKGTAVRLVPSAGPAPRTVPDLTGMTTDVATQTLADLGLVLAPLPDEFSSTVPVGGVIRQDPAPGTAVARDSAVSVALSKGPDLITVPNLAGLDYAGIRAALEGAGFVIVTVNGNTTLQFTGVTTADGAAVAAAQQLLRGTGLVLYFNVQ